MSVFKITIKDPETGIISPVSLQYDNERNTFFVDGEPVIHIPENDNANLHCRVMMGRRCNIDCQYCMQQKHGAEPSTDVQGFVRNFSRFISGKSIHSLTYEGGETLLYFEQVKAYHAALSRNYPRIPFKGFFTNGTLIDNEVVDWCIDNEVNILLSHDGPGQFLRGVDPLDDLDVRRAVQRYIDSGMRLHFTPTYHRYNYVLGTYIKTMREKLNFNDDQFAIGSFLNMYIMDERMQGLTIPEEDLKPCFRETYEDIISRLPWLSNWGYLHDASQRFVNSIGAPPAFKYNCKASDPNRVFMDTYGNITCCGFYNHDDKDVDTGEYAGAGHIKDMHVTDSRVVHQSKWNRRLKTHCVKCPLLQVCMGTCPFTPEKYFEQSCRSHYYYRLLIFAIAIFHITGNIMTSIDFDVDTLWKE